MIIYIRRINLLIIEIHLELCKEARISFFS